MSGYLAKTRLRWESSSSPKDAIASFCASDASGKGKGSKQTSLLYRGRSSSVPPLASAQQTWVRLDKTPSAHPSDRPMPTTPCSRSSLLFTKTNTLCVDVSTVAMKRGNPATALKYVSLLRLNLHQYF